MSLRKYFHNLDTDVLSANNLNITGGLSLKGITVVSPPSGSSVKLVLSAPGAIVAPSGGLTEVTLQFPENPDDGQVIFVSFTQDVAKVNFINGKFANASVLGPSVSAGDSILLFHNSETGKWYKLIGGTKATTPTETKTPAPAAAVPEVIVPPPETTISDKVEV